MATLIKNGTVVTAADTYKADVLLDGGKITRIGADLSAEGADEVDASGKLVLPGGVDVHTHLDMPFMGTVISDDFESGTIAAAHGGTTTLVDFIVPPQGKPLEEGHATWRGKAEGKAAIDYGFHMCVTEMRDTTIDEMNALVEAGITSFKMFTAYPGVFMADDGVIFRTLRWAADAGALVMFHAENGWVIEALVEDFIAKGMTDPLYHGLAHPPESEGEATTRLMALAEMADAPAYIVHLTCSQAMDAVNAARDRGVRAYAETCPQYLYLTTDDMARPDFEGAKVVCSPPVRDQPHNDYLWRGLANSDLLVVATDHAPTNFKGQKDMGLDDFRKIPNGMPALETRLHLIYKGVVDGKISLNRFVDAVATQPAKLFGLYPQKGSITVGGDADVVIWDPDKLVDLSAHALHMRVDYSPYEGMQVRGGPEKVYSRGELIVDGKEFLGQPGRGQFLARKKFDYV